MDDYGYFGKGSTGYAHYNQAYKRNFGGGGSGGGGGGKGGGCLTLMIAIFAVIVVPCAIIIL